MKTRLRLLFLLLFSLQFTINAAATEPGRAPKEALAVIDPNELRMHLGFLASPELGGRYTLSPSLGIAARYLATRLQSYGYKGAGTNGDYFQRFELMRSKVNPSSTLDVTSADGSKQYKVGDFFSSNSMPGKVEGKMVFLGYGISSPRLKRDDYAGLDVTGKIVVLMPSASKSIDESQLQDNEHDVAAAMAHGASAVIYLPVGYYVQAMKSERFRQARMERESVTVVRPDAEKKIPSVLAGIELSNALLQPTGMNIDQVATATDLKPQELPFSAALDLKATQEKVPSQNVVGVIEGTDPKLKDEYIALSAHYDHLKTNAQGQIYPGADDDGSGTVSVLNLAKAFAEHRPKRSVFIIFHAGEELGLLGSEYNADIGHAVPMDKLAVDLNIDMIGRSKQAGDTEPKDEHLTGPDTIYLVGADRISSELNKISQQANKETENLKLDYYYNDPKNPERIYYRSDHWNYAKHDVPIIFYFDGTSIDYHQPTDTIEKIDFNKMARVARLVFDTGWRIANLDHDLKKDVAQAGAKAAGK